MMRLRMWVATEGMMMSENERIQSHDQRRRHYPPDRERSCSPWKGCIYSNVLRLRPIDKIVMGGGSERWLRLLGLIGVCVSV